MASTDTPTCCNYVPKDFVKWKDGKGVPKLTPPNRR